MLQSVSRFSRAHPKTKYGNVLHFGRRCTPFFLTFATAIICVTSASPLRATIPPRVVSVVQFGALPDDTNDDTDAVNAAIRNVADSGGGTVTFPAGTYLINSKEQYNPILSQSHVCLKGQRDPSSGKITSILKMPRPYTNRTLLVIGDPRYANEATDQLANANAVQNEVEITDLAFDLDNGHGRRAIQLRYLTRNVYIHDCEGFQSGLDRGEAVDTTTRGDNHFFNLGSYGDPKSGAVSQDITIERCKVRGKLQLTADGGAGCINLTIQDNEVSEAVSHGIAVTSVSPVNYFQNIKILNNKLLNIGGDGIYVSEDRNDYLHFQFHEGDFSSMHGLLISGNTLELGPSSIPSAGGIHVGSFLEFSDVEISNNSLKGYASGDTSRFAMTLSCWDYNWNRDSNFPTLSGSAFASSTSQIRLSAHRLVSGMQIELQPVDPFSRLPSGLDAFRRYYVKYVDENSFSLGATLNGPALAFGASSDAYKFAVVLSPAITRLKIANNQVYGFWNYGLVMYGSVEADLLSNQIENTVAIAGEHETLSISGNDFGGMFINKIPASEMGCSFLGVGPGSTAGRSPTTLSYNHWTVDETQYSSGSIYTALVTFDPRDPRRKIEYVFQGNTIAFPATSRPRFASGVRDRGQTGAIFATYINNTVDRGVDSDPNNQVPVAPAAAQPIITPATSSGASASSVVSYAQALGALRSQNSRPVTPIVITPTGPSRR